MATLSWMFRKNGSFNTNNNKNNNRCKEEKTQQAEKKRIKKKKPNKESKLCDKKTRQLGKKIITKSNLKAKKTQPIKK